MEVMWFLFVRISKSSGILSCLTFGCQVNGKDHLSQSNYSGRIILWLSVIQSEEGLLYWHFCFGITDWDECAFPSENDCSMYAECINAMGSYRCRCKTTMDTNPSRPGRNCEGEQESCIQFHLFGKGFLPPLYFLTVFNIHPVGIVCTMPSSCMQDEIPKPKHALPNITKYSRLWYQPPSFQEQSMG